MSVVPPGLRARLARSACALVLAGLAAACGNQTGILLEIHKDDGVSSEVYALEVFVGLGGRPELFDPAWRVAASLDGELASVTLDQELGADTYRVLLEPGDALDSDDGLVFAVAGYEPGQAKPVVFGHTDRPIGFGDGQVRVLDLPLATFRDASHGVTATGCAWWNDAGDRRKQVAIVPIDDADCDAFKQGHDEAAGCQLDCDDRDPAIRPGATEVCANGIDENCCADNDGQVDLDGDTFATCGAGLRDCVDGPAGGVGLEDAFGKNVPPEDINPEADELCDGIDNNCVQGCDEGAGFDPDGDRHLNCTREQDGDRRTVGVQRLGPLGDACAPSGLDCAEQGLVAGVPAAQIHPGALDDQCDGVDQDCDGRCDQLVAGVDGDGDGFVGCATEPAYTQPSVPACARGAREDCGGDDSRFELPGASERCDGLDYDCDLQLFPAVSPCFVVDTTSGAPRCVLGKRTCNDQPGAVDPGFGACERELQAQLVTLPPSYCALTCDPTLDPVQCVSDGRIACTVNFGPGAPGNPGPTVCAMPPPDVTLPADPGMTGCTYALIGGARQGAWTVTLVDPQGATGVTASGCGSRLRVTGAQPDADEHAVLVMSGVAPHVYRLKRADGCDVNSNMSCQP